MAQNSTGFLLFLEITFLKKYS